MDIERCYMKQMYCTESGILDARVKEFKAAIEKNPMECSEGLLEDYFGISDPYARAWYTMYKEMISGGSIFTENELAGYACFYRSLAHAWTIRQQINGVNFNPNFFDNAEWEEVYNALDPIQVRRVVDYCVTYNDHRDNAYRRIANYIRTSQTWSMKNIYAMEHIDESTQKHELTEFQQGLDIACARWQVLSTLG